MKRLGTVLVFKPGVSKAQAAQALASIAAVVDFPKETTRYVRDPSARTAVSKHVRTPFKPEDALHEYEDEHGSPVFYIP